MIRISFLFIAATLLSCHLKPKTSNTSTTAKVAEEERIQYISNVKLENPGKYDTVEFNRHLVIKFNIRENSSLDSAQFFLNNTKIATTGKDTFAYTLKIPAEKCGVNTIKVIAFHNDKERSIDSRPIIIKPDNAPVQYTYQIVKAYPHDPKAYTQGLIYREGYMYEGTGLYGQSELRKIDMSSNKLIAALSIDNQFFGEGITIYKDKIFQLTWTSFKGFVYNLNTFSLESTFTYNTQGWGITTINDDLVMSDGSNKLHYIHPSAFNAVREIEVYDHRRPIGNLNELEYINGLIWANIWLSDRIVMIDPQSGAVKGELNMQGLLSASERSKLNVEEDVLNGIAWNPEKQTVYITGKRWPKLFEIKIKEVKPEL